MMLALINDWNGFGAALLATAIFGLVGIGLMLLGKAGHDDFDNGMIYGYTLMILAFSPPFPLLPPVQDSSDNSALRCLLLLTIAAPFARR